MNLHQTTVIHILAYTLMQCQEKITNLKIHESYRGSRVLTSPYLSGIKRLATFVSWNSMHAPKKRRPHEEPEQIDSLEGLSRRGVRLKGIRFAINANPEHPTATWC